MGVTLLVADARGVLTVVRDGAAKPFDVGTDDPMVFLTAGSYWAPAEWAGVTSQGRLVRGSLLGARVCDTVVDFIDIAYRKGLTLQQKDRIVFAGSDGNWSAAPTPTGVRAHGSVSCGILTEIYLIDERRVYSRTLGCASD